MPDGRELLDSGTDATPPQYEYTKLVRDKTHLVQLLKTAQQADKRRLRALDQTLSTNSFKIMVWQRKKEEERQNHQTPQPSPQIDADRHAQSPYVPLVELQRLDALLCQAYKVSAPMRKYTSSPLTTGARILSSYRRRLVACTMTSVRSSPMLAPAKRNTTAENARAKWTPCCSS